MKSAILLLATLLLASCQDRQDPDTPATPQETNVRDKANADVNAALADVAEVETQ